jgi:two-component system nitrate/nitrite response regulator NarP
LIADDHPFFLDGLEKFLASAGHKVVARASHAREVYELVDQENPELIMLDVKMPPRSGVEILKTLRSRGCTTPIVLVTADIGAAEASEAIRSDVSGIAIKHSAPDLLMRCVDAALAGETWIDPDLAGSAIKEGIRRSAATDSQPDGLTQRELVIAKLVAQGLRNREIAEQINVTEGTIKVHLNNIYRKLGVPSRTRLALFAKEQRWT